MESNVFQSKSLSKAYFSLSLPVVFSMVITYVSIAFGIVSGMLMLLLRRKILLLLGADGNTFVYAAPYYTWMVLDRLLLRLR